MNKILLAASAIALLSMPALAADLFIPQTVQPILASAPYDWTGAYIGASVGGQGVRVSNFAQGDLTGTGVVAGLFGGYNKQAGNLVFGAEADIEYSGFNATAACQNPAWSCNAYENAQGSLRARLGFAVDTLLFYGTAGLAIGRVGGSTTSPANVVFPDSSTNVGWTVGAGIETAFNEHWFGRVEYRYTNLGTRDLNFDLPYPGVGASSHAVRAGIGYKF